MTLSEFRQSIWDGAYETDDSTGLLSLDGYHFLRRAFVNAWESHFHDTVEVLELGGSLFDAVGQQFQSFDRLIANLDHYCYGIFNFDLLGFREVADEIGERELAEEHARSARLRVAAVFGIPTDLDGFELDRERDVLQDLAEADEESLEQKNENGLAD
jgi:hypothetical protein